jgi:hypothetical protein
MQAITLTKKLESDTLYLPELRPFVGREVEITVREATTAKPSTSGSKSPNPLAGSVLRDDDPFGPAVPPEEWEACR